MASSGWNPAGTDPSLLYARLQREESGADMIEYALIATLIALAAIAAIDGVGDKISNYYKSIGSSV